MPWVQLEKKKKISAYTYGFLMSQLSELISSSTQDKRFLTAQLQEIKNQSLNLFQRRDEMDELEGFQQQELSKVKHMVRIFILNPEEILSYSEFTL